MNTKQAYEEFKSLKNDLERWEWIYHNNLRSDYVIWLDNDYTHIQFEGDEDWCVEFDRYIGWSDVIQVLLTTLGVQWEVV